MGFDHSYLCSKDILLTLLVETPLLLFGRTRNVLLQSNLNRPSHARYSLSGQKKQVISPRDENTAIIWKGSSVGRATTRHVSQWNASLVAVYRVRDAANADEYEFQTCC